MNTIDVYYIVAVWFLFLSVSNKEYRLSAAILSAGAVFNVLTVDALGLFDGMTYLESKFMLIKYDGALALTMALIMKKDKHAWKHALILSFAVTCHSMISLYLITTSQVAESMSFLFYEYYDELIIMTALLQLLVTKNGMVQGINSTSRKLQSVLSRVILRASRGKVSLSAKKNGETRA